MREPMRSDAMPVQGPMRLGGYSREPLGLGLELEG